MNPCLCGRLRPLHRRGYELDSFRANTSHGIIQGRGGVMIFTGNGPRGLGVGSFVDALCCGRRRRGLLPFKPA
jgi:hypothetical protein